MFVYSACLRRFVNDRCDRSSTLCRFRGQASVLLLNARKCPFARFVATCFANSPLTTFTGSTSDTTYMVDYHTQAIGHFAMLWYAMRCDDVLYLAWHLECLEHEQQLPNVPTSKLMMMIGHHVHVHVHGRRGSALVRALVEACRPGESTFVCHLS